MSSCDLCAKGGFCPDAGASSSLVFQQCPAGAYNPERGSSSNSHSAGPSNSPSAQASPVHGMRPAFATRPQTNYEGLAEPRPVLANFSTALPPPVTPFGTPPGIQSMPHGRNLPPPDVAVTPEQAQAVRHRADVG